MRAGYQYVGGSKEYLPTTYNGPHNSYSSGYDADGFGGFGFAMPNPRTSTMNPSNWVAQIARYVTPAEQFLRSVPSLAQSAESAWDSLANLF